MAVALGVGVVVHFLVTFPEVQEELGASPDSAAAAIDEMLRIDDPFLVNRRVTTVPTRIAEFELPPGTRSIRTGHRHTGTRRCSTTPV